MQVLWDAMGKVSFEFLVSDKASDVFMNLQNVGCAIADTKACKRHLANLQGFVCKLGEIRLPN